MNGLILGLLCGVILGTSLYAIGVYFILQFTQQ